MKHGLPGRADGGAGPGRTQVGQGSSVGTVERPTGIVIWVALEPHPDVGTAPRGGQ